MKQPEVQHTYQRLKLITRVAVGIGIVAVVICFLVVLAANLDADIQDWFSRMLPSFAYILALLSGLVILTFLIHRPKYRTPERALHLVRTIRLIYLLSSTALVVTSIFVALTTVIAEIGIDECKDHLCVQEIIAHTNLIKTTFTIEAFTAALISVEVKVILYYCSHLLKKTAL